LIHETGYLAMLAVQTSLGLQRRGSYEEPRQDMPRMRPQE